MPKRKSKPNSKHRKERKKHEKHEKQQKEKKKNKQSRPSSHDIPTAQGPSSLEPSMPAPSRPEPPYRVSDRTDAVFARLFQRSNMRGPIMWTNFKSAMAEMQFSVVETGEGSACLFTPGLRIAVEEACKITVHRPPPRDQFEGRKIPRLAARLKRNYRWDKDTFEAIGTSGPDAGPPQLA
jgi:hypothetical protein